MSDDLSEEEIALLAAEAEGLKPKVKAAPKKEAVVDVPPVDESLAPEVHPDFKLPAQYSLDDPWGELPLQMRHALDGTPAF